MHTQLEDNDMYGKEIISRINEVSNVYKEGIYVSTENPFSNEDKYLVRIGKFLFVKHITGGENYIFSCNTPVTILISTKTVCEVIDKKAVDVTYFQIEVKVKNFIGAEAKSAVVTDLLLNTFDNEDFLKGMLNRMAVDCLSGVFI